MLDSQSESLVLREPMLCCTITWVFHHCLSNWRKICGLCFLHFNAINISFFFFLIKNYLTDNEVGKWDNNDCPLSPSIFFFYQKKKIYIYILISHFYILLAVWTLEVFFLSLMSHQFGCFGLSIQLYKIRPIPH